MEILFTTRLPKEGFSNLKNHHLVFPKEAYASEEELIAGLKTADILVSTFDYSVTQAMIASAPKLRLIANFGVGYNNICLQAAKERGIVITNTPNPVVEPTAEHAFALMLCLARRTAELDRKLRTEPVKFGVMENISVSLTSKTLGIIGMGRIGQALARRACAFGMQIIYHNRHRLSNEIEAQYNAHYVEMDELFRTSDFVSLNLPYTPNVRHIIGETELKKMKPTARLINTARGAHIDEDALVRALKEGTIAGAALDVYEHEPMITDELKKLDNVVLAPHVGTGTWEGRLAMCRCVEDNILSFINHTTNNLNLVQQ